MSANDNDSGDINYHPSAEDLRRLDEWLEDRPLIVETVRRLSPFTCYRAFTEDGVPRGHYAIYSYNERKDGTVSLTLEHGGDSFLPGCQVYGVPTVNVVKCGCGKWRMANAAQAAESERRIDAAREAKVQHETRN